MQGIALLHPHLGRGTRFFFRDFKGEDTRTTNSRGVKSSLSKMTL
jgi:hypothetical protein